jgi:hypothetical protein
MYFLRLLAIIAAFLIVAPLTPPSLFSQPALKRPAPRQRQTRGQSKQVRLEPQASGGFKRMRRIARR